MSERFYALLMRLFPARFREQYGNDAMQLFHDRSRDEGGFLAQLRLWFDLFADLAIALPREYCRERKVLALPSTQPVIGASLFHILEAEPPRPSTVAFAGVLSLLLFGSFFLWTGHGRNYRTMMLLRWPGPEEQSLHAQTTPFFHPNTLSDRNEPTRPGEMGHILLASTQSFAGESGLRFSQATATAANKSDDAETRQPVVQNATTAMIEAIRSHQIVMFGETHGDKQEYEWLCSLVKNPQFAERVDDIEVEFGNSLYQKSVDRYIAGENVPMAQVEKAWQNTVGSFGPPSPVYGWFYKAVRDSNLQRRKGHKIRLVLGDPYGDWDKIKNAEDLGPYLSHRDQWYAEVVKSEVLAKHHHALLIMGAGHFRRLNGPGEVERAIRAEGVIPYLVLFGTNYDDVDHRFDSWASPAIVSLSGNWAGALPAIPVLTGGMVRGNPRKLEDVADALFYAGPRDSLIGVNMTQRELVGTPYGNELDRRMMVETGRTFPFPLEAEEPQFPRPQVNMSGGGPHPLPPMPKSMNDPLPPRPPSQ